MVAVTVIWVLYAVGRSSEQRRNDLATYLGFALALALPAIGWVAWIWRKRNKQDSGTPTARQLERLTGQLADAVNQQWEETARERKLLWPEAIAVRWSAPSKALAGPVAAAVGSTRFSPLPGLKPVGERDIQEGDITALHAVYGGLRSGRLVVAGPPGSGKSGAVVLLILEALRYRKHAKEAQRSLVPVPVLFTLHGWNPDNQSLEEWLAGRLQRTYSMFSGRDGTRKAISLLASNNIAVILDGLDEIAEELRPAALRALSMQAHFRVVVTCRSGEMAAALQEGMFDGAAAVELQQVNAHEAARYLRDVQRDPPPAGWAGLIGRLSEAPDSGLAQALSSPLAITLVRDTYRSGDDVQELIDTADCAGPDAKELIEVSLLDRVLSAAYERVEGRKKPRYDLQKAEKTFQSIASKMRQNNTTDLCWWLMSDWSDDSARLLMTGVATGLVTVTWVVAITLVTISRDLIGGLIIGVVLGTIAGIFFGTESDLNITLVDFPLPGILPFSGGGLSDFKRWFIGDSEVTANPLTPKSSWRGALIRAIAIGPIMAIFCGLMAGAMFQFLFVDNPFTLSALAASGVIALIAAVAAVPACVLTATPTWQASLAFVELYFDRHMPLRLMRFLEDAHERGVLRTVGPVYQFRHAHLRDRLADQESPPAPADGPAESEAA